MADTRCTATHPVLPDLRCELEVGHEDFHMSTMPNAQQIAWDDTPVPVPVPDNVTQLVERKDINHDDQVVELIFWIPRVEADRVMALGSPLVEVLMAGLDALEVQA